MYNDVYNSAEDACCKLLCRDGERKQCLGYVHGEDSNSVRKLVEPALLLQQSETAAADWSLPPSAVEWLHGSDSFDTNNAGGEVGKHLFQRIASEIDGLKSTVYQIMFRGAQLSAMGGGSRDQQHQDEWQRSTPLSIAEEDCYAVVPGSSQTTSSGIEEDWRESQSMSSEMDLFQSCDSDATGYSCGVDGADPGGHESNVDWQVDQLAIRMLAAGMLLDLQLRTQRNSVPSP